MTTRNDFLELATYNNAAWCDTICRSHKAAGVFSENFWMHTQQTPIYYPNLVTLLPIADIAQREDLLAEFLLKNFTYGISVKDSFALLDLVPFGFQRLFSAQWIMRQVLPVSLHREVADLKWERVTSERELERWEEAWSQVPLGSQRLFQPLLLEDANVSFLACYRADKLVAGAIANQTAQVVGFSNVFTPAQGAARYWEGLLSLVAICYPGRTVVGYERDEDLTIAQHAGFTTLGPLCVWLKEGHSQTA